MEQQEPQLSAAKGQKAEERLQEAIEQLEKVASEFTDAALERAEQQAEQLIRSTIWGPAGDARTQEPFAAVRNASRRFPKGI